MEVFLSSLSDFVFSQRPERPHLRRTGSPVVSFTFSSAVWKSSVTIIVNYIMSVKENETQRKTIGKTYTRRTPNFSESQENNQCQHKSFLSDRDEERHRRPTELPSPWSVSVHTQDPWPGRPPRNQVKGNGEVGTSDRCKSSIRLEETYHQSEVFLLYFNVTKTS